MPETTTAAYAGRWIDNGDDVRASLLPDRQGFGYTDERERERLLWKLQAADDLIRDMGRSHVPFDEPTLIAGDGTYAVWVRRAGGYVYAEAWLT
jgi:hypothetical protein